MSSETPPIEAPTGLSWLEASKSNAWTDLALTLPIFIFYHLGVVLLRVRNAADLLTAKLTELAESNLPIYWGLTLAIGVGMVVVLSILGRGKAFDKKRFVWVALEAATYALVMRIVAGIAVGSLPLNAASPLAGGGRSGLGLSEGIIMSCGAGFYEEVVFRVVIFGVGVLAIKAFFGALPRLVLIPGWALLAAMAFSGWHYLGSFGDAWNLQTFVFRAACGLVLTAVYSFRGFAPAVWTHLLYDIWALAVQ